MKAPIFSKTFVWSIFVIVVVLIPATFCVVWLQPPSTFVVKNPIPDVSQMKQLGLALMLYVEEHDGQMPSNLDAQFPENINDKQLLTNIEFLTPGRNIAGLPPNTIIARREYPDEHIEVLLYADMRVVEQKSAMFGASQ
jgi:hypothetical protein